MAAFRHATGMFGQACPQDLVFEIVLIIISDGGVPVTAQHLPLMANVNLTKVISRKYSLDARELMMKATRLPNSLLLCFITFFFHFLSVSYICGFIFCFCIFFSSI